MMPTNTDCFEDLTFFSEELSNLLAHCDIFLTGATGFFGKWLLNSLAIANDRYSANVQVTCLSRDPDGFFDKNPFFLNREDIRFIKGDVRSFFIPTEKFDYVIHGATSSTGQSQDEELYSTIVDGTKRILKLNAKKLLYISSGGVYGSQPNGMTEFSEDLQPKPQNFYGKSKLEAEKLCINSNTPTVIVRPFAFLGPFLPLNAHFAAGNFINDLLHKRKIIINSDGSAIRSYMYPSDLCEWLWKALIYGKSGNIFNIGSDHPVSILQLAERVNRIAGGPQSKILVKRDTCPDNNVNKYIPDIAKIRNRLGVEIKVSLDEAIRRTIEFYREQC